MRGEADVALVGEFVVARMRGEPTEDLLRECQDRVLTLVRGSGSHRVLYDAREMKPPSIDIPWAQRELDAHHSIALRRAVVVPTSKLAFLARIAFGDTETRVFYDDVAAAARWLSGEPPGAG